jgi:hypothetical protein
MPVLLVMVCWTDSWVVLQVMQAMCIKTESEHYRRSKDVTAGGFCMVWIAKAS